MADQLDIHTRSPNPDADNDDPLAELARIIGYERPAAGQAKAESAPQSSDFDLEAELMRELDVPQFPAVDEPELQDADEQNAFVGADADDEAPFVEEAPAYGAEPAEAPGQGDDAPWMDAAEDDHSGEWLDDTGNAGPEWDIADAVSADELARAIEDDADPEAVTDAPAPVDQIFPAEEPVDQPMFDAEPQPFEDASNDAWGAYELDQVEEPERPDAPVFQPPLIQERAPGAYPATFAPVAAAPVDDDVLADMFRFELPARDAPKATAAASVPYVAADDAGPEDEVAADYAAVDNELDASTDFLSDDSLDGAFEASMDEDLPEEPIAEEPDVPFDDDWSVAPDVQGPEQPVSFSSGDGAEPPVQAAAVDFEDFLSTELDDYEQSLTARGSDPAASGLESPRVDDAHEAAPDGWDDQTGGFEDAVFDDAAEELLADFGTEEDAPVEAEVAQPEAAQAETWSIEDIETGAGDELADELEDMVDLPERSAERPDETDELGLDLALDLEEVLADDDAGMAPDWDDTLPESGGDAARDEDRDSPVAYEGGDDWLATAEPEPAPIERDEMSEAFLGLVPDPSPLPPAEEKALARAEPAVQDDWLGGFETAETVSQPVENGFYFDPEQITEAESGVEPVADFGVPDMAHDEPQPVEPDYDSEIEREFADIIDASDVSDPGPDLAATAVYAGEEDWASTDPSLARGFEAGDAYSELERELDSDHATDISYRNAGSYADDPIAYRVDPSAAAADGGAAMHDRSGSRGPLLAAIVLGVAVVAGLGAFGWSMLSGDDTVADGGPRIIRADKEPVKVLPENPGGVTVPNQDKAVYDRVAGSDSATPGQPALVNSAEEPIDVVQRTLDPEILPLEGRDEALAKSEDRLAAGAGDGEAGADASGAPVVSPRRVRTMIVKPDGSIVAREEPEPRTEVAAAEPSAEPAVQPADTAQPADVAAAVDAGGATEPEAAAPAAETAGQADAGTEQSIAPVRVVQTQPVRAPVPESRPAEQPVNVIGTVTQGGTVNNGQSQTAPTAPAQQQPVEVASAPAASAPAANPGGYYMQIASQPTEEGAQASWRTLSSRYSSVLGGKNVDIQRADIPGKGVFHRVRVAAGSRDEANALCARYKSAGGSCFVSR